MEELKQAIMSGSIKPGEKLPSENELSDRYHISRHTVRKALSILINEGYIEAEHGRGTFCSQRMGHMKNSRNVAVVTTYISDYIFPRLIQGMDKVLTENGYSIILKNTANSRTKEERVLEDILTKDIFVDDTLFLGSSYIHYIETSSLDSDVLQVRKLR